MKYSILLLVFGVIAHLPQAEAKSKTQSKKKSEPQSFNEIFYKEICTSKRADQPQMIQSCIQSTRNMARRYYNLNLASIALRTCSTQYDIRPQEFKANPRNEERENRCLYKAQEVINLRIDSTLPKTIDDQLKYCKEEAQDTSPNSLCIKRAFQKAVGIETPTKPSVSDSTQTAS